MTIGSGEILALAIVALCLVGWVVSLVIRALLKYLRGPQRNEYLIDVDEKWRRG